MHKIIITGKNETIIDKILENIKDLPTFKVENKESVEKSTSAPIIATPKDLIEDVIRENKESPIHIALVVDNDDFADIDVDLSHLWIFTNVTASTTHRMSIDNEHVERCIKDIKLIRNRFVNFKNLVDAAINNDLMTISDKPTVLIEDKETEVPNDVYLAMMLENNEALSDFIRKILALSPVRLPEKNKTVLNVVGQTSFLQ